MTETTIQGHRVRLLSSRPAPSLLLDIWEDLGQPFGTVFRIGVVATIQLGQEATAEPFVPWADTYAVRYTTQPAPDPVGRFREALQQERERARERLGGSLRFTEAKG